MINVYDRSLRKTAVLQNAFDVVETKELNAVGSLIFSLPDEDDKNAYCQPFHYVKYGDDSDLYRIISSGGTRADTGASTYTCEHVIATLVDDVLWGSHVIGNIGVYTNECINYVLDHQTTKHWALDACEFSRQFEYGWECENLLAALFSIPNRFIENYMWEYDTNNYPWRISLKIIDELQKPQFYIRAGKNLLRSSTDGKAQDVCTRLYGLGYGEGVNQLTIKDVNNDLPYIDAPQEYIDRYGLISRIFVDRRFESAQSLKERMESLLNELKEPKCSRTISIADLYDLTGDEYDKADIGRITMLSDDNTKTYITKTIKRWDQPGDMAITLSTKADDIVSSIADLADRQRIEQLYAQGATQLYAQAVQANATPGKAATLNFYIPEGMRIVNLITAKITLERFRSYSRSTLGGGGNETTSSSGGGGATTSGSGGGGYETTSTEGERARTSSAGGAQTSEQSVGMNDTGMTEAATREGDPHYHRFSFYLLRHTHRIGSHTHTFTTPAHGHNVSIPQHSHSVSLPSHSHGVSIPQHSHAIEQGIFEYGSPGAARVTVDGRAVASIGRDAELDLTAGLVGDNGKISRGTWHKIEVVPDDMAYVTINLFTQGFIQSIGGACY